MGLTLNGIQSCDWRNSSLRRQSTTQPGVRCVGREDPAATYIPNLRPAHCAPIISPGYPRRTFRESQPTLRSQLCITTGDITQMDSRREALCVSSVRQNQSPQIPHLVPFCTWLTPLQYKCDNLQREKRAGQDSSTQGRLKPNLTISRDPKLLGILTTSRIKITGLEKGNEPDAHSTKAEK